MMTQVFQNSIQWIILFVLWTSSSAMAQKVAAPLIESDSWPVSYREQVAFSLSEAAGGVEARSRSLEASKALASAIEADRPHQDTSPLVEIREERGTAVVRVRGYVVTALHESDAEAAGFPSLEDYAQHIETVLQDFIPRQVWRVRVQETFLKIFLSVFFALLGFIVLRQLQKAFNQADHILDERRGSIKPLSLLSETLLSGEAMGGLLAFGLVVGRVLAYVLTVVVTLAAILGQFDFTRGLLAEALAGGATSVFLGFEALVKAIPGLVLAALLVVALQVALRILDLFLKGVTSGRIQWKVLPSYRVPVVRLFGTSALILLVVPLVFASIFGRFHTPLETIVLVVAGALFLSATPVLASMAMGALVIWRSMVRLGDWIEVGKVKGEVIEINLEELQLVPVEGGKVSIPMFYLLFHPLYQLSRPPCFDLYLIAKTNHSIQNLLESIESVFPKELNPQLSLETLAEDKAGIRVKFEALKSEVRQKVMTSLAESVDRGQLELVEAKFIEV